MFEKAGADAVEIHFNTPGVAASRNRVYDFYQLVYNTVKLIKSNVSIPVMCKLPLEACDPFRAILAAVNAGANAVGPHSALESIRYRIEF